MQDETDETKVRIDNLELFKDQQERTAIQNKSFSKRRNILIHGIEEDKKSVWES